MFAFELIAFLSFFVVTSNEVKGALFAEECAILFGIVPNYITEHCRCRL